MKRWAVVVACVALLASMALMVGAGTQEKSLEMTEEMDNVLSATKGFMEVITNVGVYESEDGRIESIDEKQLKIITESFNDSVDCYYTKDHPCYSEYKWLNNYLLTEGLKDNKENSIEAGVVYVSPIDIEINDSCNESVIDAVVISYAKRIINNEEYYTIENPIGRTHVKLKMIKEDGQWKVCENIEFDDLDNVEYPEIIKENDDENPIVKEAMNSYKNSLADDQVSDVEKGIQNNKRILDKQYSSYQEAYSAAAGLDVNSNYYLVY